MICTLSTFSVVSYHRGQAYVGAFMKKKSDGNGKAGEDATAAAVGAPDALSGDEGEERPAVASASDAQQLHDIGTFCQARHSRCQGEGGRGGRGGSCSWTAYRTASSCPDTARWPAQCSVSHAGLTLVYFPS